MLVTNIYITFIKLKICETTIYCSFRFPSAHLRLGQSPAVFVGETSQAHVEGQRVCIDICLVNKSSSQARSQLWYAYIVHFFQKIRSRAKKFHVSRAFDRRLRSNGRSNDTSQTVIVLGRLQSAVRGGKAAHTSLQYRFTFLINAATVNAHSSVITENKKREERVFQRTFTLPERTLQNLDSSS